MAQGLKDLRKQLRSERCPEGVLERVHERIAPERASRRAVQLRWGMAAIVLLGMLSFAVVQWRPVPQSTVTVEDSEARAIRQQAGVALAYLGHRAKEASQQSGVIILKSSLPSLRRGLRTAWESIARPKPSETKRNQAKANLTKTV